MKSLKESIRENLLNESKGRLMIIFDHENPEANLIWNGTDPKILKQLDRFGMEYFNTPGKGDILFIEHSDEWGKVVEYANLTKFKSEAMKAIKDGIAKAKPGYICIDADYARFEIDDAEEIAEVCKMNNKQLYKKFVKDYITDSFIDRDSAPGRALVDIKNEKVLYAGEDIQITFVGDSEMKEIFDFE